MATRAQDKQKDEEPAVEATPAESAAVAAAPEPVADAPDTFVADVVAHLADPQRVPVPAGAVINFGAAQPIRRIEE